MEVGQKAVCIEKGSSCFEPGEVLECINLNLPKHRFQPQFRHIGTSGHPQKGHLYTELYITIGDRVKSTRTGDIFTITEITAAQLNGKSSSGEISRYVGTHHAKHLDLTKILDEPEEEVGETQNRDMKPITSTKPITKEDSMESRATQARKILEEQIPELEGQVEDINAKIADLKEDAEDLKNYKSNDAATRAAMKDLFGPKKAKAIERARRLGITVSINASAKE